MPRSRPRAIVTGAGGFIGHHLVVALKAQRYWVRGIDLKYPEFGATPADEFELLDLRRWNECEHGLRGARDAEIYNLAANMGGIGYIEHSCWVASRLVTVQSLARSHKRRGSRAPRAGSRRSCREGPNLKRWCRPRDRSHR